MDAPATQTRPLPPFHLAFPVTDLDATRAFYGQLLGCPIGRESERWIDFDFFGHQITAHQVDGPGRGAGEPTNAVDGKDVPIPHFGAVLDWDVWHALADRLKRAGVMFIIEPHIRFPGQVGEQATMFFRDPSGNHLEFKSFQDPARIFQR
jgi:extradiol dioxygenase family protein